jgi:hypothetical protein
MTLWCFGMLIQAALFAVLLWRRAHRSYPSFTLFIGFCVVRSTVQLGLTFVAPALRNTVQWGAYVPQFIILVMLVFEVFHVVFHPYDTLPEGTLTHFLEAVFAVAVTAIAVAVRYPGTQPTAWLTFARAMDQVTAWVLCAVFGFIALFSKYFGIPWRHRVYGIGLGFLFYLSVDMVVTTIVAHYGTMAIRPIWWLDMVAFILSCIIWAIYFAAAEISRPVPSMEQLQQIRTALKQLRPEVQKCDVQ